MRISLCFRYIIFTLSSLNIVQTVPPDYCLLPLNRSNCNMAPKTVYSYYKPGSRCEIETWRGCPTANKFDNEYLCSLNCIFRMRLKVVEQLDQIEYKDDDPPLEVIDNLLKNIIEEELTTTTEQASTTEPTTESIIESTTEFVIESTTEALIESTTEAEIESTTEALIESTTVDESYTDSDSSANYPLDYVYVSG